MATSSNENGTRQAPTALDLELATLVRRALGAVDASGRFGPRKVFIAALWRAMLRVDAAAVRRLAVDELATFQHWLLGAQRFLRSDSERTPLVVLARADLVAAMDGALVTDSETLADGASYHFVLDPAAAPDAYTPRAPSRWSAPVTAPVMRGRVGSSATRVGRQLGDAASVNRDAGDRRRLTSRSAR
ncbi:MAG: hypothetical protein ACRENC_06055 [Gemmatimonadaceae bacterium]